MRAFYLRQESHEDLSPLLDGALVAFSEVSRGPKLQIHITDSPDYESGDQAMQILEVNAQGLVGGKRNRPDGCVVIGTADAPDYNNTSQQQQQQRQPQWGLNDFDLGQEEVGRGQKHMMIKYDTSQQKYFLRDLGEGSGTFVKVPPGEGLALKNGFIISFGDTHMTVNFF